MGSFINIYKKLQWRNSLRAFLPQPIQMWGRERRRNDDSALPLFAIKAKSQSFSKTTGSVPFAKILQNTHYHKSECGGKPGHLAKFSVPTIPQQDGSIIRDTEKGELLKFLLWICTPAQFPKGKCVRKKIYHPADNLQIKKIIHGMHRQSHVSQTPRG